MVSGSEKIAIIPTWARRRRPSLAASSTPYTVALVSLAVLLGGCGGGSSAGHPSISPDNAAAVLPQEAVERICEEMSYVGYDAELQAFERGWDASYRDAVARYGSAVPAPVGPDPPEAKAVFDAILERCP
jgi:hypothetical protein